MSTKKFASASRVIGTVLVVAVAMGSATGIASAEAPVVMAGVSVAAPSQRGDLEASGVSPVGDESLSPDEARRAAEEAEYLFSVVLVNDGGRWRVNPAFSRDKDFRELTQVAEALNAPIAYHAIDSPQYRECVLNAVGLGALTAGAAKGGSQLAYLMAAKKWKDVAYVLARLVGVNALKGGLAGAAVSLAGAGAWCATPWAK
ncbi:hypothetical protein [Pseudonocardia sp. ICBG601]|uniref:hypothetical protein n=1 Tax=Pseudonocardia sp. ICBG601 TaxID=2846759 RepID=UPI001CF6F159|nr:hypothetical protein [Pseudonocardia sp. ICBG601]